MRKVHKTRRAQDGRIEFCLVRKGKTNWYRLRDCAVCGQEFFGRAHDALRGKATTCSVGCRAHLTVANLGQYALTGIKNPTWKGETYEDYVRNKGKLSIERWARNRLLNAIRRGWIQRGICAECGSEQDIEGHHTDYSKPYDVVWLCRPDHAKLERAASPDDGEPF